MKQLLVLIAFAMVPSVAFAQDDLPSAGEAMGGTSDNVVYKKETEYDFDADDVEGNLVKPDEASINAEQHGKTSSLIKIRADFVPEMLKSVEDI
ncbi:MAG: hypothetical protein R3E66_07945 [bacterium]